MSVLHQSRSLTLSMVPSLTEGQGECITLVSFTDHQYGTVSH